MLANNESLNRFASNPLPQPDFIKASQHFQKVWNEFKEGYKDLGLSESQLFKRFYQGVLKQLKRLRGSIANSRVLERLFKQWGYSHDLGSKENLRKRRFFTAGNDIAGFGQAVDKSIDKDLNKSQWEL